MPGLPDPARHDVPVHVAAFADLKPRTLYDLLRLRVDVFVVEQQCPYHELDGRDTEPGTRHLWITGGPDDDGRAEHGNQTEHGNQADDNGHLAPVAYLRILQDAGGVARIGRVVVARHARGAGHAERLMRSALALIGERVCVLDAQAHLAAFYGRFGFTPTGPEFLDDGIPHIPMRRCPGAARPPAPDPGPPLPSRPARQPQP